MDLYNQTTLPGVLAVGDMAAVNGAAAGMLDGRIAGMQAAHLLGRLSAADVARSAHRDAAARQRYRRFGAALNTAFAPRAGLFALATADTPVCGCAEVTMGELRAAVAKGARTLDSLKTQTRAGQGPCQGRTCGPILAHMMAQQRGQSVAQAGLFTARPPIKPVPLAALAGSGHVEGVV